MCTDSLLADGQNAVEKGFAALTHASARVSVIWGVGQLESEKTLSTVQAVIDDEIAGAAMRYAAGFPVDDPSLAVEEVRKAGIAGSFLGTEHTLEHFRGTVWEPKLFVRAQRGAEAGRAGMHEKAEAFVRDVLSRPDRSLLSESEEKELAKIEARYSAP
jgi:trimethylamine--corrinoid protein Co-methyltransferase